MYAPVLLFVLGLVAIGAVAWFGYLAKQKRREAFALMAVQLGLLYSPEDPFGLLGEPFALFQKGDGRDVENVLSGTWQGLDVCLFDYWYYDESTDSKGDSSKTYYRFECVTVPVDAGCPRLSITHEDIGTKVANALSFHDIRFESEAFNRAFYVTSSDAKFANDLVDARMMDWLLQHAAGFCFETAATGLLCYQRKAGPQELIPLLGTAKAFREHIPRVVYSLYPK
jgi:hypothetical protein